MIHLHMPFYYVYQGAIIKRHVLNNLFSKFFKRWLQHVREIGGKPVPKSLEVGVSCFGVIGNEFRGHIWVDGETLKESWIAPLQHAVSSLRSNEGVGQRLRR